MNATSNCHTKWSKSEREKQIPYDITYKKSIKYDTNELIYETETDADIEEGRVVAKGEGSWGKGGLGVWDQQMQAIIYRMDKQQGPTV